MNHLSHSKFEISIKGDVCIIRYYREWDLKDSVLFFETYRKFLQLNKMQKFGVLSDMRQLKGGTPDAIEYFEVISDWASKNGQVARALLLDSYEEFVILQGINRNGSDFPAKPFETEEAALVWLGGFGLSISERTS